MNARLKKYLAIVFLSVLGLSFLFGAYVLNGYLKQEKRWFYATGTNEKAFLNSTWEMSSKEVERANGMMLVDPKYDDASFFNPETIDEKRYRERSVLDAIRLWGIHCDVDYKFFDDKLFEYTVSFKLDTHNWDEYDDSVITLHMTQRYGSCEHVKRTQYSIVRRWETPKVSIEYCLHDDNDPWLFVRGSTPLKGLRFTYKPTIEQIKAIVQQEEKNYF